MEHQRVVKESCSDRMIWFGEDSLRSGICEFTAHYHRERNHQGLKTLLIIIDGACRNVGA